MIGLVSLLTVVVVALLITRVATVALVLTGLSQEVARFQARSALSGAGYTTSESESVVGHPVRRRIVMTLMLLGSAGVATAVATLVLTFADTERGERLTRFGVLVVGLAAVWLLARSPLVERVLSRVIARALERFTDLDARDYAALLHLAQGYAVMELAIEEGEWLAERTLYELGLRDEGVSVLGVTRADGTYVSGPVGHTPLHAGDTLVVYGPRGRLCELDHRRAGPDGDAAHERATAEHREVLGAD